MARTKPKRESAASTERRLLCEAVDRFAAKMKAKMLYKQRWGWRGWQGKGFIKDQAVDIANFCMFLDDYYSRKERGE